MSNRKMKLLIASTIDYCVPDVKGGAFATHVFNLVKCNEIKDKMDITVLSMFDEKAEEESKKYPGSRFIYVKVDDQKEQRYKSSKLIEFLNRVSFKMFYTIFIPAPRIREAYQKVKGERFDFIFGAGGDPSEYGWFTRKVGREKMIFNVGGHLEGGKVATTTFGNFICCSDFIRNHMRDNIENCDIITILNRVDIEKFMQELCPGEKLQLKKRFGLVDKTTILFMGRIAPEKGVEQLIDAFARMRYKKECILLIAGAANFGNGGTTEFEERIQRKVKQLNNNIKMLGFIHHNELWKFMRISDMAILPSMWEEPAGNVVPECMAAGLPLIITNSGGMVEYVDKETAIVVEKDHNVVNNLKDALEYLYENPDIRNRMGEAAKKKAKDYDVMIYYDLLFKELCRLQKNTD